MSKSNNIPIYATAASLWDGVSQLSGILELWEAEVIFRFIDFKDSHLELIISLKAVERIEEYLVFDLAENGLWIEGKGGKSDLFVLKNVKLFKDQLLTALAKLD